MSSLKIIPLCKTKRTFQTELSVVLSQLQLIKVYWYNNSLCFLTCFIVGNGASFLDKNNQFCLNFGLVGAMSLLIAQ